MSRTTWRASSRPVVAAGSGFLPSTTTTRRPASCRVCRSGCLRSWRKSLDASCPPRGSSASGGVALARRRVWPPCLGTRPTGLRLKRGSVANFAHVVVKEWLPLSVGRLGGQGVEQFGRSEPLVPGLEYHLFFPDHVHEFD